MVLRYKPWRYKPCNAPVLLKVAAFTEVSRVVAKIVEYQLMRKLIFRVNGNW